MKRILTAFIAIVILISSVMFAYAKSKIAGDVNDDGKVTSADALDVLNYTVGKKLLLANRSAGDMNGDGEINSVDALMILKTVVGIDDTTTTTTTSTTKQRIVVKNGITYVDGIMIANKTYPLPSNYNPGVDSTAQSALNKMISDAKLQGISLWVVSGFRSYSTQASIYQNYVNRDGKSAADRYSARPGHSEHQTGLAFDLNSLSQSFENTPEGQWLAKNCHKYGFIIRYPKGKESKTGYMYEPWHVRYLGVDIVKKVYNSGLCLEEYLGITSQYNY